MRMYVVIHRQNGRMGHQPIGQALVEADFDASLTILALLRKLEPLCCFTARSAKQATEAISKLEELGDVEVDPHDFDAKWFDPEHCLVTVDSLLKSRARCITKEVRMELAFLRRVLTEVALRGWTFHLLEVESEDEIGCQQALVISSQRPAN